MHDIIDLSKLSFFQVGRYEHKNGHVCDFREIPRPHYCMGLILKGKGTFQFSNKTVTVTPGDIIFVPVGSTYISNWNGENGALYISAHFSFEMHALFSRRKKVEIQKISLPDFDWLKESFFTLYTEWEKNKALQFKVLGAFFQIMSKVYPEISYTAAIALDKRIEKAIDYIELHYKEKIPVDDLAALSNMSTSHFHACFKDATGLSPIEYKHRVSVRKAELMLVSNANQSIEEISDAVGFSSSIYFRELFKKTTGKTPTEYRRQMKDAE